MKSIALGVVLLVVALNLVEVIPMLQRPEIQKLDKELEQCARQNQVSDDDFRELIHRQNENSANSNRRCYFKCVLQKERIVDDNGRFLQRPLVLQLLGNRDQNATRDQLQERIDTCNSEANSQDSCENAVNLVRCYRREQNKDRKENEQVPYDLAEMFVREHYFRMMIQLNSRQLR